MKRRLSEEELNRLREVLNIDQIAYYGGEPYINEKGQLRVELHNEIASVNLIGAALEMVTLSLHSNFVCVPRFWIEADETVILETEDTIEDLIEASK